MQFDFLANDFRETRTPPRPVNVFELSGFPRWETVASRVLAYFLDPRDSRHGLGSIGIDTLLQLLDGLPTIGFLSRSSSPMNTATFRGSLEWNVETEAATDDGNRIDILLTNDDLDLAIAVENKIDAAINNPFESYARRAGASHATILSIVMAPTRRSLPLTGSQWISGALTYDEFFDPFVRAASEVEARDERSMDLLVQFIENTSEKEQRVGASAEADMLDRFWAATTGPGHQLGEFFKALVRVNKTLRRRAEALHTLIRRELEVRGLLRQSRMVSGNDRTWGRSDGRVAIVYVVYELTSGNCIELMIGQHPDAEWTGFAVKAYPNRSDPGAMYSDFHHLPLSAGWRDPDADVVAEFLHVLEDLERKHPRGVS